MHAFKGYLIVFLGAGFGGSLRHAVNVVAARLLGYGFPYGTLTVNVAGSLLLGLLAGWFAHRFDPGQSWRLFLVTGVLGGFTTFSAFSLDTAVLYERSGMAVAAFYVATSVGISLICVFLGLFAIRQLA